MVSIVTYTGDGSTTDYTIPFEYLDSAHVVVELTETVTTAWSFLNDTTVRMDTAPASGDRLVIKRATPDAPIVDFTDGSTLFEADLDLSAKQSRLLGSEARDRADEALQLVNNNLTDILAVRAISSDVSSVASNETNINAVQANEANINTVSANTAGITTVSSSITNVNTVAGIDADITTVAGINADVTTLAAISSDIDSLGDFTVELETIADDLNNGSFIAGTSYDFGSITDASTGSSGSPDGFIVTVYNNLADVNTVAANIADLGTIAPIAANVTTVAGSIGNVNTVSGNIANVNTVAGVSSNVSTVASISADVSAVASDATDIGTVAGLATEIGALGAITSDITAVNTNAANVTTVAGISGNVSTVANISTAVNTVASNNSNVTAVASNAANINTVASDTANINALGPISANISTVSGIAANVTTVAGISTDTSTVAGVAADVTAVASNNGNITTVAGISADVSTVAADSADIQTVADNLTSINDFADKYRIGTTDPTTDNDEGDLFYNTTSDTLKVYNGSAWEAGVTAGSGFMPISGGAFSGAVTFAAGQTFDGRDVSADGTKLDGIEANADVTDAANVEPLIDAHINVSGATSGQYLGWNGTDYAWSTVDLSTKVNVTDYTAADVLTKIKTVDGSGSGLDADTLDGQQGSYYYPASNPSGYTTFTANQSLNTSSSPTFSTVTATNFNTTSDANLKTNVTTLSGSLDKVKALRGVSFDWEATGTPDIGVIAQEVEKVLPELVSINDNGIKSVKYSNIVGVLIEAIKEQQAQIDALTQKMGDS